MYLEAEKMCREPDTKIYYNLGKQFKNKLMFYNINSTTICILIGLCYMNLGEWDKSKEYFQRTIQLSRNQDAYEKLASIFAMENNLKNATNILITASK